MSFEKFKEAIDKLAESMVAEEGDPFASWQGMDLQRSHLDKESMDIVDHAIRLTAAAKTASERNAILQKYAEEVGVPYSLLRSQIEQDTGSGYFDKDDYMQGKKFQSNTRESKLMDSYKSLIKHKR